MGNRPNRIVYRVRWKRQKWTCHRTELFPSRKRAEKWRDKVRAAWPNGSNPIEWVDIDRGPVLWEHWQRESPASNLALLELSYRRWETTGGPIPNLTGLTEYEAGYAIFREMDRADGPDCYEMRDGWISFRSGGLPAAEIPVERSRLDAVLDTWIGGQSRP